MNHPLTLSALGLGLLVACSATSGANGVDGETVVDRQNPEGEGGATGGLIGDGGRPPAVEGTCLSGADDDGDEDGFTVSGGDCNDCDPNVNPGAIEVSVTSTDEEGEEAPVPADENCNGEIDEAAQSFDDNFELSDMDPLHAACAIGLCQKAATSLDWGVVDAQFVRANGSVAPDSAQWGILTSFGPNVPAQSGSTMLALSSGRARIPGQAGACNSTSCTGYSSGSAPPGFPQDTAGCDGASDINDDVGLQVRLRAPRNATGYSFLFSFYSFEYPEFVCDFYNDQFIALVDPAPAGSKDGNISFDSNNNPVSVNVAFFNVCDGCAQGTDQLLGTGFDTWSAGIFNSDNAIEDAGATGWLKTTAPVVGGEEITVRFAIWDTGDTILDSTVVIDNFEWIASGGTVAIGTEPAK